MSLKNKKNPRALISVSDKTGLTAFAEGLVSLSFEIISTGGTAKALRSAGVSVTEISEITKFPEIMDGRVKTLHPSVHGGLLARTGIDETITAEHGIDWIDLLVVNLYPFESTIAASDCTHEEAIEKIDIGGPAMVRAAAKNHTRVTVIVDPNDYPLVLESLQTGESLNILRSNLAAKAFTHTAYYDALISQYLRRTGPYCASDLIESDPLVLGWRQNQKLRYGENPHQEAALFRSSSVLSGSIVGSQQTQGKPLSFNNIVDAEAALECAKAFSDPVCAIIKHANPCGVAISKSLLTAYQLAFATDPQSAFGGIIAFNRKLDSDTAKFILQNQMVELIIAPEITQDAHQELSRKKNVRVLETGPFQIVDYDWNIKSIAGGLLVQSNDFSDSNDCQLNTVTKRAPTSLELKALTFAWSVVKFVKSNAIVYTSENTTLGIGAGQTSRVMSARIAAMKAADSCLNLSGASVASDAFFPFRDGIDIAAEHGITSVIQPGGSMRDEEVIAAADEHGMAMVFTGMRHFRH
jgi:phosphoribosylaminoimidazolecarboxamide formyltransferase / IMP cyclohydrolase